MSDRFPIAGEYKYNDGTIDAAYTYTIPYNPRSKVQYGQRFAFYLSGLGFRRFEVEVRPMFRKDAEIRVFWSKGVEDIQSCFENDQKLVGFRMGQVRETQKAPVTDQDYVIGLEEEYPVLTKAQ